MTSPGYRIDLDGRISDRMLGPYLDDFTISRTRGGTTLSGHLRDAAHLHGVILHLTGLGLRIRTVQQTDHEAPVAPRNPVPTNPC